MGFLSHRVEKGDLEEGDHIYTWRIAFAYAHHGIYVGGNKVVHFTSDKNWSSSASFSSDSCCFEYPDCCSQQCKTGVIMSCLNCFLGNDSLYRFQYGVHPLSFLAKIRSGTSTTAECDPPETVIDRAMYLLKDGFGHYDFLKNNCEDFALYCKTGLLVSGREAVGGSGQVSNVVLFPKATAGSLALGAIKNPVRVAKTISSVFRCASKYVETGSFALKLGAASPVYFAATTASLYFCKKYADDIGVRGDVTKVRVREVSQFLAKRSS